ncbi:MAG TPA: VCBS repeat-containing protein, partial [Planctomycetota bacterium]|nr:VCBS repeat-containing protein [Planctomycetota bacterium]
TTSAVPTGALVLVDGSTHTVAWTMTGEPNTRLGEAIAAVGDQDGDGKVEIASNAPSTGNWPSSVHVINGSSFGIATTLASSQHGSLFNSSPYPDDFAVALASGFDLDHDGRFDLAIGSPGQVLGDGYVMVCRADPAFSFAIAAYGSYAGEGFGASIDGSQDFDGDGTNDLVVGAPNHDSGLGWESGRAVVLSGSRLIAGTPPFELHTIDSGSTLEVHFGACVRASPDLNNDGTPDFIVGMPDFFSFPIPAGAGRGGARIYSGKTGARLASLTGVTQDHLGAALLGGFLDLNQDGFVEFAVAGSLSDNSGANVDCGTLKFYSLFPGAPSSYCTAKINSLGCVPSMSWNGTASASSSTPFVIQCANLINKKAGMLIYSHGPNALPFQGGTLCVQAPLKRTGTQNSGGSPSGSDCTGTFSYDLNARIQSGLDPTLVIGAEVFCQCWSRDPASSGGASLSNAVRCLVNP